MTRLSDQLATNHSFTEPVNPNLLDNSNFQIVQRGKTFNAHTSGYTADRWKVYHDHDGTLNVTVDSLNDSRYGSLTLTTTGASSVGTYNASLEQVVPWFVYSSERGRIVTVSAELDTDKACNVYLRHYTYINEVAKDITVQSAVAVSAGKTRVSWTFTLPDSGDLTGTTDRTTFQFYTDNLNETSTWSEMKFESGNKFTGYEPTPYAQDEAECEKWLQAFPEGQNWYNSASTARAYIAVPFRRKMYFRTSAAQTSNITLGGTTVEVFYGSAHIGARAAANGDTVYIGLNSGSWVSCEL